MGALRNYKYELFAKDIVAGVPPAQAYVNAGFKPHRANHFRMMRYPAVAARITELKMQKEDAACAARMPPTEFVAALKKCGIETIDDFFERDAAGILRPADLQHVPVEVAINFLRNVRKALNIGQQV